MAQIMRERGPVAAWLAMRELARQLTPPDKRPPADPWIDKADTIQIRFGPLTF